MAFFHHLWERQPLSHDLHLCLVSKEKVSHRLSIGIVNSSVLISILFVHLKTIIRSSHHGSVVLKLTSIHEDTGFITGLAQWVNDLALPCGVV